LEYPSFWHYLSVITCGISAVKISQNHPGIIPTPHEKVKVFLGGLATDFCVKSTALDIAEHFKDDRRVTTYLLIDAIRAVGLTPTNI
jgi:hypothetical protein